MNIFPWQSEQQALFERWQQQNRLPHGLLLHGSEGIGKQAFARQLGRQLLLGSSAAEQAADDWVHPDWRVVGVPADKKWIVVDQIRELLHWLYLSSRSGGEGTPGVNKVAVIAPAERMNVNAANALLKGLEEPPEGAIMLLVTSRPGNIPATIRSRCQDVFFPTPSLDAATEWLIEAGHVDERYHVNYWATALGLAGGAPMRALDLHEQGVIEARRNWLDDLDKLQAGRVSASGVANRWSDIEVPAILEWLFHWCGDLLKTQQGISDRNQLRNTDFADLAARQGAYLPAIAITRYARQISEYQRSLQGYASPQLMLEASLSLWAEKLRPLH